MFCNLSIVAFLTFSILLDHCIPRTSMFLASTLIARMPFVYCMVQITIIKEGDIIPKTDNRGVHGSGTWTKRAFGSGIQNFGSDRCRIVPESKIIDYPIISVRIFVTQLPNCYKPPVFGKQLSCMLPKFFWSPFFDNYYSLLHCLLESSLLICLSSESVTVRLSSLNWRAWGRGRLQARATESLRRTG